MGSHRTSPVLAAMAVVVVMALQPGAASAETLGPVGGNGGFLEASQCTDVSGTRGAGVMIGVRLRVGSWVDRIEAVCSLFTNGVRSGSTFVGLSNTGSFIGGSGGQPFELICGTNKAVVGMKGRSGIYLDALSLACAALNADGTIKSGTTTWTASHGGSGGSPFGPLLCTGGPARDLVGRGSSWVDRLEMRC